MPQPLLMLLIALLCYLVIPGCGAVSVRRRWRRFRARVVEAAQVPLISPQLPGRVGVPMERLGVYRFSGALEAIQGQNTVWLRGAGISVAVLMEGERVHMVPSEGESAPDGLSELDAAEHPLLVLRWRKLHAIAEGTGFYVFGAAYREHGKIVFKGEADQPLMVLVYDGDPNTVLERALWYGRQSNEYWNPVTVPALAMGVVSLTWLAYRSLSTPIQQSQAVIAVLLASLPVLPLLPPGAVFLLLYRRLWKRGRLRRAQRDMLLFRAPAAQDAARRRSRSAELSELSSLAALGAGLGVNSYLLLMVITRLLL